MPKRKMAAFRLPPQTIAELDLLVAALQRRSPGKVSQADAIAWALARVLAELTEGAEKAAPQESAVDKPAQGGERPLESDDGHDGRPVPLADRKVAGIGGALSREADLHADQAAMVEQRELRDRLAHEARLKSFLQRHDRELPSLVGKASADEGALTSSVVDGEPGADTPSPSP